jgi:hypothetical protein
MPTIHHDEIILERSSTRLGSGGWVRINGMIRPDLAWLAKGHAGVTLFPTGAEPVSFRAGEDHAFRVWVEAWARRNR